MNDLREIETKALNYALQGLDENCLKVLYFLVFYEKPIQYELLTIFNPLLDNARSKPPLPRLPQPGPSPFLHLLDDYLNNYRLEEIFWERRPNKSVSDTKHTIMDRDNAKKERNSILDNFKKEIFDSKEHFHFRNKLNAALRELVERNLINWNQNPNIYDVHDIVRVFVIQRISTQEKVAILEKVFDQVHNFYSINAKEGHKKLDDLMILIHTFKVLFDLEQVDAAAALYQEHIGSDLARLNEGHIIVELISPYVEGEDFKLSYIQDKKLKSYLINSLSLGYIFIGKLTSAKEANLLNLASMDCTHWDKFVDVYRYSQICEFQNQLISCRHALDLASKILADEEKGWTYLDELNYCLIVGQLDEAKDYLKKAQSAPAPTQSENYYSRLALNEFELRMYLNEASYSDYEKASEIIVSNGQEFAYKSTLQTMWGQSLINLKKFRLAAEVLLESVKLSHKVSKPVAEQYSLLAECEASLGNFAEAKNYINKSIKSLDDEFKLGIVANVYANVAKTYLLFDEVLVAKKYANRSFKIAASNGKEFIRYWPLKKVGEIFAEIGENLPDVSTNLQSIQKSVPYEIEISKKFRQDNSNKSKELNNNKTYSFIVTKFSWLQIGVAAFFNFDDEGLVSGIAQKLTSLSYIPAPIIFSKKGDIAPIPKVFDTEIIHQEYDDLEFSFEEFKEINFYNNILVVLFIRSTGTDSQENYAFVGIKIAKLKEFLKAGETNAPIDLKDYGKIIRTGVGQATLDDLKFMREQYIFDPLVMHARVFNDD